MEIDKEIKFVILLAIFFSFCSVDYSLLEERYCTASGECANGYFCDPETKRCVKESSPIDYDDYRDVLASDISISDESFLDGKADISDISEDYFDYYDYGVDSEIYEDIYSLDIKDTGDIADTGCKDECDTENQIICTSPNDYKICIRIGECLVWEIDRHCESNKYCDNSDNKCKEQICKPLEIGCDNMVAYKCNSSGFGFDYAIDCSAIKKICSNGECVNCQIDCSGKCEGEDDGCFGKCTDPCHGKGECQKGICVCNTGYEPPYCDKCAEGFTNYPDCIKCGGDKEPCCENQQCALPNQTCTYGICRTKCPEGMVRIGNSDVCIDSFEASNNGGKAVSVKGASPWVNLAKAEAQNACSAAGKRLCSSSEWSSACKGPNNYLYPYGNIYESKRCVDLNAGDKCNNGDGSGVLLTGSRAFCEGGYPGIFDMSGNVWEWISDSDASGCKLMGGSVDCCNRGNEKPACLSCNSLGTQRCDLKWSALGFRCCKDVP